MVECDECNATGDEDSRIGGVALFETAAGEAAGFPQGVRPIASSPLTVMIAA